MESFYHPTGNDTICADTICGLLGRLTDDERPDEQPQF